MVAYGNILLVLIFAVIGGIIIGALYMILSIMWGERKAKKEFKEGKAFEVKNTPTQKIKKRRIRVPELEEEILPISDEEIIARGDELEVPEVVPDEIKVPEPTKIKEEPKPKEKSNYKEDFKKFQKANKELEKLLKKAKKLSSQK